MRGRGKLAVLIVLSVAHFFYEEANADEPINLNQSLFLTPQQRMELAVEAMRGSSEAATKIAVFFGFVALNPTEQHRWVIIAAENGDAVAQFNAYQDFMHYDTELDRERALFWLKKSAASGDKMAQDELKGLEGAQKTRPRKNAETRSRSDD